MGCIAASSSVHDTFHFPVRFSPILGVLVEGVLSVASLA